MNHFNKLIKGTNSNNSEYKHTNNSEYKHNDVYLIEFSCFAYPAQLFNNR